MGTDVQPFDISLSPWCARMDSMDAGYQLAMEIGENRADGELERDIARRHCLTRGQMRLWLKATPERWAAFSAAKEARADELVDETITIADAATPDDVAVAGLRVKARQWYAERANKGSWGGQAAGSVAPSGGGPAQIQVIFVDAMNGRPEEKVVNG